MQSSTEHNMFLHTPLGALFVKTALPIILVMLTNGLFTVVDGWFIGRFIGADALSAVTMVFPLYMVIVALATLVSGGFSSIFARYLGAGELDLARKSLSSAMLLALLICFLLVALYMAGGYDLALAIANGSLELAGMGDVYLSLSVYFSILFFYGALFSDMLRCQGYMGFMTLVTVGANVLNGVCNYILVVHYDMGVAGAAYGTAMAQTLAIIATLSFSIVKSEAIKVRLPKVGALTLNWRQYLALGAPTSLTYVGVSALTGSIIYQMQNWSGDNYAASAAAYGIINRLFTFGYMPLLGMTLAQQTIVGNNYGGGLMDRAFTTLKIGIGISFVYCATLQFCFTFFAEDIAALFVDDPAVIAETTRIMPLIMSLYILFGPLLMISNFFQAVGDAGRAALLSLTRVYLIAVPSILLLPNIFGEIGIWYASPLTELLGAVLTIVVVGWTLRKSRNLKIWMERRYSAMGPVEA
ncbi:MATE family efflux transporter [Sneathiella sp. P13V-1]|uniref:MATE family efflux transporter n=1 Tax=Sneathiella sp. P13V-1 TaxID=2697366 RepID=UPI00187B9669|nr:MATE family efflux transporter [Sneathiella sp. P13V-1]MBE7636097.1 MATE family efflux transporter [Sneathiella sp. P13V-1]